MEAALAIAPDIAKTSALTRWDALAADIAIASNEAEGKKFNYRDKSDNKEARSWVAQLRKIKGKIESARKDAKAVHLERGKAVDESAKLLEASVQGLIDPHVTELKALEAEEQARIDGHKAVLQRIADLAEGVTTSDEARHRLAELGRIDATKLEEFATVGASRQEQADEKLQALMDALLIQEAERAELERLRAEQAEREEAQRVGRIRQEAIEADRLAREAEAERQREAAASREAQALANVADAQQAQQLAEQRAAAAEREAEVARQAEAKRQAEAATAAQQAQEAREKRAGDLERSIEAALQKLTREQVAVAIVAGTLHPAISVDWTFA
jgi:colicin import membrane protein